MNAVERAFAVRLWIEGPDYDLAIHRSGNVIVIEAEPSLSAGNLNAGAMLRSMLARVQAFIEYRRDGVHARFVVPGHFAVRGEDDLQSPTNAVLTEKAVHGSVSGIVLLVEDNMIIALEAEDMLLASGADSVLVASSVAGALQILETTTPDLAMLDVNLGTEVNWPVATRLRELGVTYIFCTGYGDGIDYPLEHRSAASIIKPYTIDSMARALVR